MASHPGDRPHAAPRHAPLVCASRDEAHARALVNIFAPGCSRAPMHASESEPHWVYISVSVPPYSSINGCPGVRPCAAYGAQEPRSACGHWTSRAALELAASPVHSGASAGLATAWPCRLSRKPFAGHVHCACGAPAKAPSQLARQSSNFPLFFVGY
eukprot:CAMPEP_0174380652 /NCGR_PEP_ID=MMETSP0811_2-20130205/123510_1 /TAXON_ID=73025 ORGANISM="Eutreptiella gymnastica-like, Strain CCMP1594" /NCGR_SAMPLE_ID=MMETSP0811_2 /ASSEMBLY_ACC=CAM_ASM_000667 /LENGTH=156 /DNA_ID=CAMNT_0015533577 /DNA_START=311 /DNA_END=781 /DNA_ORIENTATION=-